MIAFLAATGLFLGVTHFWVAGTSVLVALFIWQKWYFRIHWIPLSLGGLLAIAGIWSHDPLAGILWACQLQMLFALWHAPINKRKMYEWLFAFVGLLMIAAFFEVVWLRDYRPETIVKDASLLGFSGMGVFHPFTGIAGSRTAVAGIWLFAVLSARRRLFIFATVATVFLFVAPLTGVTGYDRFTLGGLSVALNNREKLIEDSRETIAVEPIIPGVPVVPVDPVDIDSVNNRIRIPFYGLGYHSYVLETGLQRPHNLGVLVWYELGYLSILFWSLCLAAIRFIPWRVTIMIILAGNITEEWFSRPEALAIIFSMVLSAHYWIPKFNLFARFHARIKEQRRDVPASS